MSTRVLLIVLAALAVGLGAGIAVGVMLPQGAPGPTPAIGVDADSDAPAPQQASRQLPPSLSDTGPAPHKAPDAAPPQPAPAKVSAPPAAGVVRGRFTDQSGRPVPGVAVELRMPVTDRPERPRRPDFADDESYFDAVMDFHRRNERAALDAWRRIASDADGRFEFTGVGNGNNLLSVRPAGYLIEPGVADLTRNVLPGDDLEFKLFRAAALRVRADAADGEKGKISIEWKRLSPDPGQGMAFVNPGVDSTLSLTPGRYELRAVRGERRGGPITVDVGDTAPAEVITLTFAATRGVAGRLVFDGGYPLHLVIRVARAQSGLTDEEVAAGRDQGNAPMVPFRLAADGASASFQWEQAENGEHVVAVQSGYRVVALKRVTLGDGLTEVELRPSPPPDHKQVLARVQKPAGAAAEKPMFALNHGHAMGSDALDVWVVSASEYRIYFQERAGETAKTAKLACTFQMLGTAEAEFRPGFDVDVLLKFEPAASVQFSFKGEVAKHPHVSVIFTGRGGPVSMHAQTAPRAGGFQLRPQPMQPGAWRMEVQPSVGRGFPMVVREVELKPGENTIEIELPELHALRIDASAHKERWGMTLEQRATGRKDALNPDQHGITLLTNVPPGQYRLVVPARRPEETEVVVNIVVPTGGAVVIPK